MKIKEQNEQRMVLSDTRLLGTNKVIIDKVSRSIALSKRLLFLIPVRLNIQFSEVLRIGFDQRWVTETSFGPGGSSKSYYEYDVYVRTHLRTVLICQSTDGTSMRHLADEIGKFIGKPQLELPEVETMTREELTARWKQRQAKDDMRRK
ncbi:MAG: hypothetical protein JSW22_03885 [Chloroflexota bacterium]|nr:MAG: hypothetical protein JSW22_03885 [Chloroflexota bacterium]